MAARFREEFQRRPDDNQLSWDLGVTLYHRLQGRLPPLRVLEDLAIPYRDDNRFIWAFADHPWDEVDYLPASQRQVRRKVSVLEMVEEVDCELAGDDAQEIWVLETPFYLDQEGCTINELEGKPPVSEPYHYPEWDYQVQLYRPNWATVLEKQLPFGDPGAIERILAEHRPTVARLRRLIDALKPRGLIRQRRQEDGDEIDLDAAIRAMVDMRLGATPDPRINIRHIRKTRDLVVLLLLDLSESTNQVLPGTDRPVIQLTREAATLLAHVLTGIGDPFAIHGFASDGRHDVQYFRFKDFDQPFDERVRARLAGMSGGLSTRMGAALRHAGRFLRQRTAQQAGAVAVGRGAGGYRRAQSGVPAFRHQKGGGGTRHRRGGDLLSNPGPRRGRLRGAHLRRQPLHRAGACAAVAGTVAISILEPDWVRARGRRRLTARRR